jgi:hypothetical protein
MDKDRKEEEVKIKDLIRQLEWFDPEAELALKERDGRVFNYHRSIRAYTWEGRILIDGHNPEK